MKLLWMGLLAIQMLLLSAEEASSQTYYSMEEMPEDLALQVYSIPVGFEAPDLSSCLEVEDYAECERLMSTRLTTYPDSLEITIYLYGTLGMFAEFQSHGTLDRQEQENHRKRALGYYEKGVTLASRDQEKYHLHFVSFIRSQSLLYAKTGDLDKAIESYQTLTKYTGVGTGKLRDELAARAVMHTAKLRLQAGHDTTEVRKYLEGMKENDSENVAFHAKFALLNIDIKAGDMETAKREISKLRTEYADVDSVGMMDLERLFRGREHAIQVKEDFKKSGREPVRHDLNTEE